MKRMIGGLTKRAARATMVVVLLACGLMVGSALGGGFSYATAAAQEGEDDNCENDHCGRIDVNFWFDRDACLPNGDEMTGCDAIDKHGNCGDTGCQN